jgi:hypothetical protein
VTEYGTDFKRLRVLVCGGRDYQDRDRVHIELNNLCGEVSDAYPLGDTVLTVIHGACPTGADALADEWAVGNWAMILPFPADWERYGRAAGPMRNEWMIKRGKPDLVLAFPGGKGTADMVRRAKKHNIPIKFAMEA